MKRTISSIAFLLTSVLVITPVVHSQLKSADQTPQSSFPVTLTGKETFQKLVKAGKYDSVDEELLDVNPKPATIHKTVTRLMLVSFLEDFPIEELPARLAKAGLHPATLYEQLAFGAQYPKEQLLQGRPILSPDATLEFVDTYDEEKLIRKYYVYLRGVGDKRILGVSDVGMFWNKNWRCLAAQLADTENTTAPLPDGKSAGQKGR